MKTVKIGNVKIGGGKPFVLIAGPCVIESEEHVLMMGREIKKITEKLGIPYVFKASFDKANRTSIESYRGPGAEAGVEIFRRIKEELGVPILTDIHTEKQCAQLAEVVDILQIPAFLCRQTDLLLAAAQTSAVINIKKGQFFAPWDITNVVKKIESEGKTDITITERGVSFGYNNLVSDMRSLVLMRKEGYPIVFDATHSAQLPGGKGNTSGGQSEMVPYLAKAAIAVGVDAVFMEVHNEPEKALSDGPNMVRLDELEAVLVQLKKIDEIVKREKNKIVSSSVKDQQSWKVQITCDDGCPTFITLIDQVMKIFIVRRFQGFQAEVID